MREFQLQMVDGKELTTYEWTEVKNPVAVIQLVHGSAERAIRYDDFAKRMNEQGIIVVAEDHRGHGKTAVLENQELGFFAKKDGWNLIVDDLKVVNAYIKRNWQGLPIFMLGHSMGSFMARTYAIKYSESITGLILSGTAEMPKPLIKLAKDLSTVEMLFKGSKHPAKFIWNMSYRNLNKNWDSEISNGSEWQCQDPTIQGWFVNDELCGQVFSTSAFRDMFKGMLFNSKTKNIKYMRNDLPILIISGEEDVVGDFGKTPEKLHNKLTSLGYDSELIIYPKLRHEILFELEKNLVEQDILKFINQNKENHF
ncbi:alpha/beta fold hydrolase [Mesoplasma seiffertii]|uniref:alpha/beta fold hydrolase n=1 Tax=Mesoplasma seiffertii TaxID=28224 RepID=UPI00047C40DC|nr:alpha/beta fold hydrolase [Mesoplasma seiffertii]